MILSSGKMGFWFAVPPSAANRGEHPDRLKAGLQNKGSATRPPNRSQGVSRNGGTVDFNRVAVRWGPNPAPGRLRSPAAKTFCCNGFDWFCALQINLRFAGSGTAFVPGGVAGWEATLAADAREARPERKIKIIKNETTKQQ
jgi:hypothetical protein